MMQANKKKIGLILLLSVASLLFVLPVQVARAQAASVSVSPQSNPVTVGQTLTINIVVSDISNVYGVDIALMWDTSMLRLDSNQSFVGVSNGILNTPIIEVQESASQQSGEYNLIVSSESPAGPWSGSATIATLTFTVTGAGQSALTLESSSSSTPVFASYVTPGSGDVSEPISVNVVNGNVYTASASSSPSPSAAPTSTASTSPSSSSSPTSQPSSTPTPTPKIPEFPAVAVLPFFLAVPFVLLLPKLRKQAPKSPR